MAKVAHRHVPGPSGPGSDMAGTCEGVDKKFPKVAAFRFSLSFFTPFPSLPFDANNHLESPFC